MKEPILSREEVAAIAAKFGIGPNSANDFAEALLENLLGKPVAYTSEDGLRLLSSNEEICVWAADSPLRRKRDIPLYTLKDRQS
ncbi:hypothetical protein ABEG10_23185 [Burkholderia cenocepacia]|uniref:hypothetical protein n=1 Tax=Burkholderia cenocepacia TaxID=95486 RepID=UPI00209F1FCD|nr:hypothetical protein [Burkholderia cenocepacia]MCO8325953.1 hypothetical protein [Burkholderia cenocepacia]MCO8333023.1 hypothetical protein [Burkholderia cenocepacia]MCO8340523.1 hypothetical protein [Burkholderia cenocepacia]MCO8347809.1 hypothetical protein [Burkholderia cenocepacia]MCO8360875.1 hypothetical protein [Burkholderia cenocepacia]